MNEQNMDRSDRHQIDKGVPTHITLQLQLYFETDACSHGDDR
ncbi:hypothetical protein ACFL6U_22685 [Planctomycetota bacterium]